jgi:hypothetical protein
VQNGSAKGTPAPAESPNQYLHTTKRWNVSAMAAGIALVMVEVPRDMMVMADFGAAQSE